MYFSKIPSILHKVYPKALWSSKSDPKLRWTFDDGPDPSSTPILLEFLEQEKIKATFFCLGERVEKYPDLYDKIIEAGHQIGNHGYRHLSGWSTSLDNYLINIKQAQKLIDSKLFRPSYGRMTIKQYHIIKNNLDLDIVMWSNMPGDFEEGLSPARLAKRLDNITDRNSITVLHDEPKAVAKLKNAWMIKENEN